LVWSSCNYFDVSLASSTIPQLASDLAFFLPGNPLSNPYLDNFPILVYAIKPSGDMNKYRQALFSFFGTNVVSDGYFPVEGFLLHLPMTSILSGICILGSCMTVPPNNGGVSWQFGFDQTVAGITPFIEFTNSGDVNLLVTLSSNTEVTAAETAVEGAKIVKAIFAIIGGAVKLKPSQLAQGVLYAIQAFGGLSNIGDLTISVVSSQLTQPGRLQSQVFFDFVQFASAIGSVLDPGTFYTSGFLLAYKLSKLALDVVLCLATAVTCLVAPITIAQVVVSAINFAVQAIGHFNLLDLGSNPLFQVIKNGVSWATNIVDPPGLTIYPAYFSANGSLVLGYDSEESEFIWASRDGFLIAVNDTYYAYTGENVTEKLLAVGSPEGLVPYVSYVQGPNRSAVASVYSGLLPTGTNVSINSRVSPDGGLIQQPYLRLLISVVGSGVNFLVSAVPIWSNGTRARVSDAYLFLNSTIIQMNRVNASLFQYTIAPVTHPQVFQAYAVAPGALGGFGSGQIPAVSRPTSGAQDTTYALLVLSIMVVVVLGLAYYRRRKAT